MKIKLLISTTVAIMLFSLSANAQLGLQLGYTSTKFKNTFNGATAISDPFSGVQFGLTYDLDFYKYAGIQTGVLYSFYYKSEKNTAFGQSATNTLMYHYVTIPLNAKGKYDIGKTGLTVFGYIGPDFIVGVAAHSIIKSGVTTTVDLYDADGNLKRFDIALAMGAGVQFKSIRLKFGYDLGLMNLTDTDNVKGKRNHFNVALGFLF